VTVIEASTNGSDREAAYAEFVADGGSWKIKDVAARLELGQRQAGTVSRQWKERLAANGGSSASGVLPPRSPAPRAIDNKPGAKDLKATSLRRAKSKTTADRGPLDWAVIAIVGVTVAAVSYSHIVDLAILAGHGWRAYLAPIALDGLAIAAIRAWQVGQHRRVAAVGIAVGIIGSVAANVLAVRPELVDLADVSAVLAAFPPIALAVIVHLVRR
jgi:hypothetical protein